MRLFNCVQPETKLKSDKCVSGSGWSKCNVVKRLLAEKLIDDFYGEYESVRTEENSENYMEQFKAVLPTEQNKILESWKAANAAGQSSGSLQSMWRWY